MTSLHYTSLTDIATGIRTGALRSETVTAALLERIAALDPQLRSYARVFETEALLQSRARDAEAQRGDWRGPLHGVPIAVKDLLDIAGTVNASGTRVMAAQVSAETATAVGRLLAAGAVVLGKTQLTEGAFAAHHPDIDPPINPWSANRWTGVSSSGSGVAVAAGLACAALGTDTGGSIRFPSAACGVVGLKPTYGRVSRHGAFPLAGSLDHIGPMTRSVADAARMLEVMAGPDPLDPSTLPSPVPDFAAWLGRPLAGVRVGVDWSYVSAGVDTVVVGAVREAGLRLTQGGAQLVEIHMPTATLDLVKGWNVTCGVECARAHAPWYPARKADYGPVLAGLIELGLRASAEDYAALERLRHEFRADLDAVLRQVDVLLMPNMPWLPPPLGLIEQGGSGDIGAAPATVFTAPFNYSGHPTLSLPIGQSQERLPLSVQLVGARGDEGRLFQVGHWLEAEFAFPGQPLA